MRTMADTSLGLRGQALAVLASLAETEPDFAEWDNARGGYRVDIDTFALYNGRERSVGIAIRHPGAPGRTLVLVWGENRNSDHLFVDTWETDALFNPPTLEDYPASAYDSRKTFGAWRIDRAADYIMERAAKFYRQRAVAARRAERVRKGERQVSSGVEAQ